MSSLWFCRSIARGTCHADFQAVLSGVTRATSVGGLVRSVEQHPGQAGGERRQALELRQVDGHGGPDTPQTFLEYGDWSVQMYILYKILYKKTRAAGLHVYRLHGLLVGGRGDQRGGVPLALERIRLRHPACPDRRAIVLGHRRALPTGGGGGEAGAVHPLLGEHRPLGPLALDRLRRRLVARANLTKKTTSCDATKLPVASSVLPRNACHCPRRVLEKQFRFLYKKPRSARVGADLAVPPRPGVRRL